MTIKLITLDLDHTLWDPDSAIQRGEIESHQWLAEKIPAFAEQFPPEKFIEFRIQLWKSRPEQKHYVSQIRRNAFLHALQLTNLPDKEAHALAEAAFQVFWRARQQVIIFPETQTLLENLSRRFTLGAISNGNACLKTIGLAQYFSFHFSAEDFSAPKPAPDMFLAALEKAGVAAHEALHIGDHPVDDIEGANKTGMKTLWVNFQNKPWESTQPVPDFQVNTLTQITEFLNSAHQ
jgi:putative hydrolase of the HAD superfamily